MKKKKNRVSLIMGSISDSAIVKEAEKILKEFGVGYEKKVFSCHRSPRLLNTYVKEAEKKGIEVFVCFAGMAAALPGIVASLTSLPVIACALEAGFPGGLDALLSVVRLPKYTACACTGIGKAGAINAALYALKVLALQDSSLKKKLESSRKKMEEEINRLNKKLK